MYRPPLVAVSGENGLEKTFGAPAMHPPPPALAPIVAASAFPVPRPSPTGAVVDAQIRGTVTLDEREAVPRWQPAGVRFSDFLEGGVCD